MCGILGYIGEVDEILFRNSLDTMLHRGPDGSGIKSLTQAIFGHRRLSIIDLSQEANQPFILHNRFMITFNGEIYNYPELRTELQKKGIRFNTESDTEVLLNAYIVWGTDCFKKFNGMWALGIWDREEGTLILSRDRLGKKPLFYHHGRELFCFSSEMKGLYGLLNSVEIDYENVGTAIKDVFSYESTDRCLIKGIKRFPAATYGIFKNGKLSVSKYWDPLKTSFIPSRTYPELQEQFRELFFDACRIRMRSDVPIGTALSGGLDSSAVICAMDFLSKKNQASQKDWQHAFVACFPGSTLDESQYAKTVTDYLNINCEFIDIDPIKDLDSIYRNAYLFEEIYYAPTIPFVQLYRKIREYNVKVSIDGHGADELFAGYPFDMDFSLADTLPNPVRFVRRLQDINMTSGLSKNADFLNKGKFALINRYDIFRSLSKNRNTITKINGLSFLTSRLYESTFKTVLPTLLRNYDRYSMINGIEIRMPFLDYRLVEFAFKIPDSAKIRNGYSKAIIRDSLKDILPTSIYQRKKKIGFNSPMNKWMNKELKNWISDTVNSREFNESSLISPDKVRSNLLQKISKPELSYKEAEDSFTELIPFIWEKSLMYVNGK